MRAGGYLFQVNHFSKASSLMSHVPSQNWDTGLRCSAGSPSCIQFANRQRWMGRGTWVDIICVVSGHVGNELNGSVSARHQREAASSDEGEVIPMIHEPGRVNIRKAVQPFCITYGPLCSAVRKWQGET